MISLDAAEGSGYPVQHQSSYIDYSTRLKMNQSNFSQPALSNEELEGLQLDNEFWQCSLNIWKNDSLREALLTLQDDHGYRVNLLLFAIWLGKENKLIEPHMTAVNEKTQSWHDQVVTPLRRARKSLPKHSLRKDIQQSELRAEQIEQALMFDLSGCFEKKHTLTVIETLIENLFASRLPESHLLLCIQACLPDYSESDIQLHISKHKAENT